MIKVCHAFQYKKKIICFLGLSCDSNSVCMLGYRPIIRQLAADGRKNLKSYILKSTSEIETSSGNLSNFTDAALVRGQLLLDDLGNCSKKNGMAVIACYKNIIATDVIPVKLKFLEAIKAHKKANNEVIEIRKVANVGIDDTVKKYRDLLEQTIKEALECK